jgi:uroporphyrinogen-III decarboxylase
MQTMTPRQRALAALSGSQPDQLPVMVPYQSILIRDHWEQLTRQPWWLLAGYDIEAFADVIASASDRMGTDIVSVRPCPTQAWRDTHRVEEVDGQVFDVDTQAGTRTPIEQPRDTTTGGSAPANPIQDVEEVGSRWPLVTADEMLADGSQDLTRLLAERLKPTHALMGAVGSPVWGAISRLGLERGMMAVYTEVALFEATVARCLAQAVEQIEVYAKTGVDVVWLEECMTSRDMIAREHFERYAQPANEHLIAGAHQFGLKVIHYFCGDVDDRLDLLVAAGPDAIGLEESKKGFDLGLERLAARVPSSVCLLGNVDAVNVLPKATPDELADEIRGQADTCLARGPFILSLGSPVTPGTPIERVREFTDMGHGLRIDQ